MSWTLDPLPLRAHTRLTRSRTRGDTINTLGSSRARGGDAEATAPKPCEVRRLSTAAPPPSDYFGAWDIKPGALLLRRVDVASNGCDARGAAGVFVCRRRG